MIANFYVPTVKDVLYCMEQVELDAIDFIIKSIYYPELIKDKTSMFVYTSVLDNMPYKKQIVAYYLIGKALDISEVF